MSYGREAGILCAAGIHSLKSTCLSARWPLPAPPLPSSQQVICHSELRPHEKDLCRSHCPTLGQTDLAAAGESVCQSGSVTEKKSPAPSDQLSSVSGHANTATPPRHHATTSMEVALEDKDSCSSANVEYHQAFRDRWKETDATMCRHSMSFHLHHAIRSDFFASYLYLLDKTPMVKLFPVTCEYIKGEKQFYYRAQQFYEDVEASEEGMMGDFVEISHVDLEGSRQFLQRFVGPGKAGTHCALDCGSGIGRVTKGVLLPVFEKMEMADMMEHFLLHAHEEYLGDDADRIETYYCYNLQEFTPPKNKYDVIWMQWVACHLTDKDLMNFLFRCKKSLRPNGVIIMKDNMARQGCKLDSNDSTISRHLDIMKCIIAKAGLEVLEVELQEGFPEVIMPVWMIAMK